MGSHEQVRQYLQAAGVTQFRPSPGGWYSACPFHQRLHRSKGLPFSVDAERGVFICHSQACGRSGTVATILSELLGMSWQRAKEIQGRLFVASRADAATMGALPPWEDRGRREVAEAIDPAILGLYARCPRYMLRRGFDKRTLRAWDVGYDPDTDRVTFPVWDEAGRLVGFTKRRAYETEDPFDPPYLHLGFQKGEVLYGAHRVEGVSERFPAVVHESTMSVLWQAQHGVPNAVATLGAKVSERQVRLLARYPWVTLGFDGDAAGVAATRRVLHGTEGWERQDGRWQRVQRPGLVSYLERGHLRVLSPWPKGRKDLQELSDPVVMLARSVPWEEWVG